MSELNLSKVKDYNTSVSNNLDGQDYTIEADAEFFTHLSKRIYTDSMLAIVRELTCNAWDSQVEAGNAQTPIIIHCPNLLEPVFKVIDYGMGIDLDTLKSVYSSYGKSTKRSNMNLTGGLGVGSKTPFAYTDSFTVYSVKDGIQHIMVNYKDKGIPKIKEIISVPTDEPNGVRIEVPIKVNDFESFEVRIKAIAGIFHGNIQVTGIRGFEFEKSNIYCNTDLKTTFSILDYQLPDSLFCIGSSIVKSFTSSNWLVLMGNVPYQLDLNKLDLSHDVQRFIEKDLTQYNKVTCLEVPVGLLDFSMSREHLEYSDRTKKVLVDMLSKFRADVAEYGMQSLLTCTNDVESYQSQLKLYRNASTIFDEPKPVVLPIISLNIKRRMLERLISIAFETGTKKIPLKTGIKIEDYKFSVPAHGKHKVVIIGYEKRSLKRKKISAFCQTHDIRYSSGHTTCIVLHCNREQLSDVRKRVELNLGKNLSHVDILVTHLDDIAVERDASDPMDKILGRKVGDKSSTVTVQDIHDDTDSTTMWLWVEGFDREPLWPSTKMRGSFGMAFNKLCCNYSPDIPLLFNEDDEGEPVVQPIRIVAVNITCMSLLKKYKNLIHVDDFIEAYRDELIDGVNKFLDENKSQIIYMNASKATIERERLMFRTTRQTPSTYDIRDFSEKLEAVRQLMKGLGMGTILSQPLFHKTLRLYRFIDRKSKREEINQMSKTQYGSMVLSLGELEDKIALFKASAKKRENKLRYSKRK